MEVFEESSTTESVRPLNLFLANTRSIKGKTTELQFLTTDFDIICLTETHLDETIANSSILSTATRTVLRRDRSIHGGGVLIAVSDALQPKVIDLSMYKEEVLAVRIQPNTIVCCYYRPHIYLSSKHCHH